MGNNQLDLMLLSLSKSQLEFLHLMLKDGVEDNGAFTINLKNSHEDQTGSLLSIAEQLIRKTLIVTYGETKIYTTLIHRYDHHIDAGTLIITLSDVFLNEVHKVGCEGMSRRLKDYAHPPLILLKRAYSSKLYLLLRSANSENVIISVNDIRAAFAIDDTVYSVMQNFKKRVLDVAVADINEYTDISVSYDDVYDDVNWRSIVAFTFNIQLRSLL